MRFLCLLVSGAFVVSHGSIELENSHDGSNNSVPPEAPEVKDLLSCQLPPSLENDRYKKPQDCDANPSREGAEALEFVVFFFRHAKSAWNDKTEEGNFALLWKIVLEVTGGYFQRQELGDAVLTQEGLASAVHVRYDLQKMCSEAIADDAKPEIKDKHDSACVLMDGTAKSLFVTSNLRRAILTALIVFRDRIKAAAAPKKIDQIYIHSALQEDTRNADSTPITPADAIPYLAFDNECPYGLNDMKNLFEPVCGNKDENDVMWRAFKGADRLERFCEWMGDKAAKEKPDNVVIVGHSIWVRKFFNEFTERSKSWFTSTIEDEVMSSFKKLSNDGVLKFKVKFDPKGKKKCTILRGQTSLVNGKLQGRR